MRALWVALVGRRRQFAIILLLESLSGGVEAVCHPLLVKALFDQAIIAKNFHRFVTLGLFYLLLGFTINISGYWIATWRKRYENNTVLAIEMELLDRTMALDGRKLSEAGNASYASRIHNDVYEGVLPSIDTAIQVSRQAIASVSFLGVLLYLSWQASLILLVIVPPLYVFSKRLARKVERNTESEREAEAQYINRLTRTLEAFYLVRGLPLLYPPAKHTNSGKLSDFLGITYINFRLGQKQRTVSDLVMNISDTASMVTGAYFVFAGRLTFGGFLAFVNSLWRALTGVFFVINALPQFRRNIAVLDRIQALRDSSTPTFYSHGNLVLVSGARIRYKDGPEVSFEHFELNVGEQVLLRAPNGAGKTTLLHVISGALAPDVGLVTRPERVAVLTAPVQLPPLTVEELVPDQLLRAELGLQRLSEQAAANLSSGQRQRVGVAALLSEDADLYLVDEPFANLDADSRELVLRLLLKRTAGRGLLMVHHGDEELNGLFDRVANLTTPARQS